MNMSEIFLWVWAVGATTLAVMYREASRKFRHAHKNTSILLAEVVTGEVKPVKKDGYWVVENEDMKLAFKKLNKGEDDGIQE